MIGWWAVAVAGALCTGVWVATGLASSESHLRGWPWSVRPSCSCCTYCGRTSLTFEVLLAWAVPTWTWALGALAAVAAAAAQRPAIACACRRLPLGIWIAAALAWGSEEDWLRCDDYLALRPPSTGRPFPPRSHIMPRRRIRRRALPHVWQDQRQAGGLHHPGDPVAGGIDSSVCEARLRRRRRAAPSVSQRNKSQGLVDLPGEDCRHAVGRHDTGRSSGRSGARVVARPGLAIWASTGSIIRSPRASTSRAIRRSTCSPTDGRHPPIRYASFEPASTIDQFLHPGELLRSGCRRGRRLRQSSRHRNPRRTLPRAQLRRRQLLADRETLTQLGMRLGSGGPQGLRGRAEPRAAGQARLRQQSGRQALVHRPRNAVGRVRSRPAPRLPDRFPAHGWSLSTSAPSASSTAGSSAATRGGCGSPAMGALLATGNLGIVTSSMVELLKCHCLATGPSRRTSSRHNSP